MVRGAIAPALGQTCPEIEVIAVDDGSTDRPWDVITRCATQDTRVVPLRMARNSGPTATRNIAITRATGRWLALPGADDALMPERLSAMAEPGNHALERALLHRQTAVDFAILREVPVQGDLAARMHRIQRVSVSYPLWRARAFMARRLGVPRRTGMAH